MIRVRIEFPDSRYTAVTDLTGGTGEVTSEWPPSPYRVVAALLAGASALPEDQRNRARGVLQLITEADPPVIWTPESAEWTSLPARWKPSSLSPEEGKGILPDMITLGPRGADRVNRAVFHSAERVVCGDIYVDIPVKLTDEQVAILNRAALRVPYFGRSTHPSIMTVSQTENDVLPDHEKWMPGGGEAILAGWTSETLTWLDRRYRMQLDGRDDRPTPSRDSSVGAVRIGYRSAGENLGGFVVTMRLAIARSPRRAAELMTEISRLGLEAQAFPLVDLGHEHAQGMIRGVGVRGVSRVVVERAAAQVDSVVELNHLARGAAFLSHGRWTGRSPLWVSATPLVSHASELPAMLAVQSELAAKLGVEPEVVLSREPMLAGQVSWPDTAEGLRQWFAAVRFPDSVAGPLMLGERTESGYGLFMAVLTS